jgi:hypothetical protein
MAERLQYLVEGRPAPVVRGDHSDDDRKILEVGPKLLDLVEPLGADDSGYRLGPAGDEQITAASASATKRGTPRFAASVTVSERTSDKSNKSNKSVIAHPCRGAGPGASSRRGHRWCGTEVPSAGA